MNNITTFDNYPPFATNGSRNMNTESAKYAVGFLEGETFPAEWANYLFHGATKGVSDLNTAVQSIWKENINVIQGSGQTPSSSDNTQLKTAIELMIQNAVLTANAQVLAQAKLDAHPVGSLYWSSDPTDPSTLFGGTWVRIKDRFVLAAGDTYTTVPEGNATSGDGVGGSATVHLTESNLPAHTHSFDWSGSHTHKRFSDTKSNGWKYQIQGSTSSNMFAPCQQGNTDPYGNFTIIEYSSITVSGPTGNGNGTASAIDIMPPYIVKYCWERVS